MPESIERARPQRARASRIDQDHDGQGLFLRIFAADELSRAGRRLPIDEADRVARPIGAQLQDFGPASARGAVAGTLAIHAGRRAPRAQ